MITARSSARAVRLAPERTSVVVRLRTGPCSPAGRRPEFTGRCSGWHQLPGGRAGSGSLAIPPGIRAA
jgi:hypothetical protein